MPALTAVVHGYSGVGKSWVGDTVPAPRLILDAEGGADYTPSQPKIIWDVLREEPPVPGQGVVLGREAEGVVAVDWQTCVVRVRDFGTLQRVFQWLNSGQHHFVSVVMDSLTEIQKRCMDQIVGTGAPQQQDWGALLRYMEGLVREFRDLKTHPIRPLWAVVFICLSADREDSGIRPLVQGQLRDTLEGFVDVVGYLYTQLDEQNNIGRKMLIQPYGKFKAKDRTNTLTTRFGAVVDQNDLDLARMLAVLNEREAQVG